MKRKSTEGERTGRDGFRYATLLFRTGVSDEVELLVTVTPLGAVARLEHALEGFDEGRERFQAKKKDAERRLESYRGRQATPFAFAEELAVKRRNSPRSRRRRAGMWMRRSGPQRPPEGTSFKRTVNLR